MIPNKPVSPKVEEGLWGCSRAPARPDALGPSHDGEIVPQMQTGEVEAKENKPHEQGGIDLDQKLLEPNPEEVAAVVISDDDEADLPLLCHRLPLHQKVNQSRTKSDPWRTGVHAHCLQRSG